MNNKIMQGNKSLFVRIIRLQLKDDGLLNLN